VAQFEFDVVPLARLAHLVYIISSMKVNTKNTKRGRPLGQTQDRPLQMRVSDAFIKAVDDWRRIQPDLPSRTEAIRRLVELGLAAPAPRKR
jgi:hypothetical protein